MTQPIPEDARFSLAFLRTEFCTSDDEYRDMIWKARNKGHRQRSSGKWPVARISHATNVTALRARHKGRTGK